MSLNPSAVNAPRFGRALLALTAAATIAASPFAADTLGPAGSRGSGHAVAAYGLAMLSHDVGHNDWAFQGTTADGLGWAVTYLAVGLFCSAVAVWLRRRGGGYLGRVLTAAWGTLLLCAGLSVGAVWFAEGDSTFLAPLALHVADLCSPWWACVATTGVVAWSERNAAAARGVLAYAVVLAVLLLVPLPGPDAVKALVLAASAAGPALVTPRQWAGQTERVRPATG
ncbi:hypothetical protein KDL01_36635 [Actinospica durhamensis]|uniref:DUF998 domain-containing protein n=1 Tax=Actinospica durhamensis TaxID=1508375 RepID=A0A941EYQ1_9ACTN|nr:hypothetical protein [Actinospica durhamensis]MBR7838852.1 hypothetical protein [Actinospica durhamensis]